MLEACYVPFGFLASGLFGGDGCGLGCVAAELVTAFFGEAFFGDRFPAAFFAALGFVTRPKRLLYTAFSMIKLPLVTRGWAAFGLFGGEAFGLSDAPVVGAGSETGAEAVTVAIFLAGAFFLGEAFLDGRGTILKKSYTNQRKAQTEIKMIRDIEKWRQRAETI